MSFAQLGAFITMAYIMPGAIVASFVYFFFPHIDGCFWNSMQYSWEILGFVILAGFVSNIMGMLFEGPIRLIWCLYYPKWRLNNRGNLWKESAQIKTRAECQGKHSQSFETLCSEYVFLFNTSVTLFVLSILSVILSLYNKKPSDMSMCELIQYLGWDIVCRPEFVFPALIFLLSCVSLSWICPQFYKQILDSLEAIKYSNWILYIV